MSLSFVKKLDFTFGKISNVVLKTIAFLLWKIQPTGSYRQAGHPGLFVFNSFGVAMYDV